MFPWLWIWCPVYHYPWSGAVAQKVDPDANWFFQAIPPRAGNGSLEAQAFSIASYGTQLGLVSDVLLHLAAPDSIAPDRADASLARLKQIHQEIETLKTEESVLTAEALVVHLHYLKANRPAEFERLRTLLSGSS